MEWRDSVDPRSCRGKRKSALTRFLSKTLLAGFKPLSSRSLLVSLITLSRHVSHSGKGEACMHFCIMIRISVARDWQAVQCNDEVKSSLPNKFEFEIRDCDKNSTYGNSTYKTRLESSILERFVITSTNIPTFRLDIWPWRLRTSRRDAGPFTSLRST